jgi:hypothetical protein
MKRTFLAFILMFTWSASSVADVVAKASTWIWRVSVESTGDAWADNCTLKLVAESYELKRDTSIKRQGVNCALFGPVGIAVFDAESRKEAYAFLEAGRGGDGDHSGPIVEVYRLSKQGVEKLGETELFEASYLRSGQVITSVTGKVLFSFCDVCDGPESSEPLENIYVPVRLTIGCGGLCIKPTLAKQERDALLRKFEALKQRTTENNHGDSRYGKFVVNLEKEFRGLLAR